MRFLTLPPAEPGNAAESGNSCRIATNGGVFEVVFEGFC